MPSLPFHVRPELRARLVQLALYEPLRKEASALGLGVASVSADEIAAMRDAAEEVKLWPAEWQWYAVAQWPMRDPVGGYSVDVLRQSYDRWADRAGRMPSGSEASFVEKLRKLGFAKLKVSAEVGPRRLRWFRAGAALW